MANALVTGSNRGIGLALVKHLLARGDRVTAVCRHSSRELGDSGAQVASGVDVTDPRALDAMVKRLDGERFDAVWLNAGVLARDALGSIDAAGFESMRHQFEVNALGPLRVAQALLPHLAADAKVTIVTSRMGSVADNDSGGSYGYRASKAAVNAIGKSLAVDLRPRGVAVYLLHPGYVATDMVGGHGDITPQQAAERMVAKVDALDLDDTGTFWHSNGSPLPW
jgi:NAD(P)-dependent dehydrogenase (short-subunit alcohol dehydrogenase family)